MSKNTSQHSQAKFVTGNLMKHVLTMSFTASIGLMAIFAVELVDMIFISMLGNAALAAAVGYAGTLLFFTNAINIGVSIAAGSLVAKNLGAGDKQSAREYATSVTAYAILLSSAIATIVFLNLTQLLSLLGASGDILHLAESYLRILIPTMPIMAVAFIAMAILRSYGDARRSMFSSLFGGIANAILDPIFIFTLGLGLEGAAWASVCARLVILYFAFMPTQKIHNAYERPNHNYIIRDAKPVFAIAIPAILTNIASPVGTAIIIRSMAKYGTDAVAGVAIIGRLIRVAFAVIFALSGAIGPIIGQNFGAKRMDRVKETFLDGIKFIIIYTIITSILLYLARPLIHAVFDSKGVGTDLINLFCGPLALAFAFNGIMFVSNASFNNLGHPIYSTWLNWGRNTIGTLPFVMIGANMWGAQGILIGQAFGGFIFAIIAFWLAIKVIDTNACETTDPFQKHKRFQQILGRRGGM